MKRIVVALRGGDAVFSASAATEGGHATLRFIPGSALLGWTAARLYGDLGGLAWQAFHSGVMRFGNAYPLAGGESAWPLPQSLRHPKGARPVEQRADGPVLNSSVINELRPVRDQHKGQFESFKGGLFVAASGRVERSGSGRRMKTSIEAGTRRAAAAQLFGYEHLRDGQVFAALLECDEPDLLDQVAGAIRESGHLNLGRSRRVEYGGRFACSLHEAGPNWEPPSTPQPSRELVLWLLSDLAAVEMASGSPTLHPAPQDLGLGPGHLVRGKSFLQTRVYAPWNAWLGRRERDRPVIAAGSILTFKMDAQIVPAEISRQRLGLFREQGLGHVVANPVLLSDVQPQFAKSASAPRALEARPAPKPQSDYERMVLAWLDHQMDRRVHKTAVGKTYDRWNEELMAFEAAVKRQGGPLPSRAQWGRVREEVENAESHAGLTSALFAGVEAVCRDGDDAWSGGVVGDKAFVTTRQWLQWRIENERDLERLRPTLARLAGEASRRMAQERG